MKHLTSLLIVCFLIAQAVSAFAAPLVSAEEERIARFERNLLPDTPIVGEPGWLLKERMRHYRVPGLQVAVLTGGKMAWTKGYGVADPKTKRPVTAETLFDGGSISKAVTTIAVLKLVDGGLLSLDTPVNDLLRSWKLPENDFTRKTPVTLRRLLSHTAGTNINGFWGYLESEPLPDLRQILDGISPAANSPVRVEAEPGKGWRYSGGGFVIVQQMIEDVTHKPFAETLDEILFRPLKMRRSTFVQGLSPELRSDVATPTSEASYFKGRRFHPHASAAGLYTTASDLARLIEVIYASLKGESGSYLSQKTARLLVTPVVLDRDPWDRSQPNRRNTQKDQALGLMGISRNGKKEEATYAFHDGLNAGFRSRMMFNPETGDGTVLLYNSDGDEEFLLETTRGIAATYGWKNYVSEPIRPIRLDTAELDRYVGRYRRSPDNIVTIKREGNHLLWTDLWTATQPIYPIGDHAFEHRQLFGRASRFTVGKKGQIATLDEWSRIEEKKRFPVEYLLSGQTKAGVEALRSDVSMTEERLGNLAFNLLETHRLPRVAAEVLRVTTERFPGSSGGWDALGDALKRAGDKKGGVLAEARASALRDFRDRLTVAFEKSGVEEGNRVYRELRAKYGLIPLGDLLQRLGRRLQESGKQQEAEAVSRL